MFNDRYGLTEAVLSGRKTQTRRLIPIDLYNVCDWSEEIPMFEDNDGVWHPFYESKYVYKVGEVVAVAQSYKSLFEEDCRRVKEGKPMRNVTIKNVSNHPGWDNKMFVRADQMPQRIRITNVRVERLQGISDADCLAEGVIKGRVGSEYTHFMDAYYVPTMPLEPCVTPQNAYAILIDRISGKGTWERNPCVFVYDFELVK